MFFYIILFFIVFFFFNDTATTEIYTLSLHDALPISRCRRRRGTCSAPLHHARLGGADARAPPSSCDRRLADEAGLRAWLPDVRIADAGPDACRSCRRDVQDARR